MSRLSSIFDTFSRKREVSLHANADSILELDAACPVLIKEGTSDRIKVSLDGEDGDMKQVKMSQDRNKIKVLTGRPSHTDSIKISSSDGKFRIQAGSFTGGIAIGPGARIIGGKSMVQSGPATRLLRLVIEVPRGAIIDATTTSDLISQASNSKTTLNITGSGDAEVAARSLNVSIAGSGDVRAVVNGGNLRADLAGSGDIRAEGNFQQIEAKLVGSGDIKTNGTVTGDYVAQSVGSGDIAHRGKVRGRTQTRGSVNIRPF